MLHFLKWLEPVKEFLLPNHCVLCKNPSRSPIPLCKKCEVELPLNTNACHQCGLNLKNTEQNSLCGQCLVHPPPFDHTISLFHYQYPIDKWLAAIKFHQQLIYANLLGNIFAKCLLKNLDRTKLPQLLIPVPLHRKRLVQRGFNQALELAKPISKLLQIPIDITSVIRVKNTQPQTSLSAKDRKKNIKNAFQLQKPIAARHITVIDDVITTNSTVKELSRLLKKNGVEKIDIWSIARAG